jgi:hypothetical protein
LALGSLNAPTPGYMLGESVEASAEARSQRLPLR